MNTCYFAQSAETWVATSWLPEVMRISLELLVALPYTATGGNNSGLNSSLNDENVLLEVGGIAAMVHQLLAACLPETWQLLPGNAFR